MHLLIDISNLNPIDAYELGWRDCEAGVLTEPGIAVAGRLEKILDNLYNIGPDLDENRTENTD